MKNSVWIDVVHNGLIALALTLFVLTLTMSYS